MKTTSRVAAVAVLAVAAQLNVGSVALAAQSANVVVTTITAASVDPYGVVPNFDVARNYAGAGIGTWDIGYPEAVLQHGNFYVIAMTLRVTNFTGTCKATYKITRGSTVLDSGVLNKKWGCATGDLWGWTVYTHTIPNSPGQVTLTGTVSYGTQKASMSVPMVVQ